MKSLHATPGATLTGKPVTTDWLDWLTWQEWGKCGTICLIIYIYNLYPLTRSYTGRPNLSKGAKNFLQWSDPLLLAEKSWLVWAAGLVLFDSILLWTLQALCQLHHYSQTNLFWLLLGFPDSKKGEHMLLLFIAIEGSQDYLITSELNNSGMCARLCASLLLRRRSPTQCRV